MSEEQISIGIPTQLQNNGFRFIRVSNPCGGKYPKAGKEPMDKDWTNTNCFEYDNNYIVKHINRGNNYGVIPKYDNVCVFDVDDINRMNELDAAGKINFKSLFENTFTVLSGHKSKNHSHIYFKCHNNKFTGKKIVLSDVETQVHLGEIYMTGFNGFVIGPNSKHEHGNKYSIVDENKELITISANDLNKFINYFNPISDNNEQYQKRIPDSIGESFPQSTITQKLNLRIGEIAFPNYAVELGDGEYQGSHPVHGSSTGHNFNINIYKNVWRCFRCNSGGDPAVWLAVQYGLIDCKDAQPGVLDNPDIFKKLIDCLKNDIKYSSQMKYLDAEFKHVNNNFEKMLRLAEMHHLNGTEYDSRNNIIKSVPESDLNLDTESDNDSEVLTYVKSTNNVKQNISKPKISELNISPKDYTDDIFEEFKSRKIFEFLNPNDLKFTCKLSDNNYIQEYVSKISELTDSYKEYHYASVYGLISMVIDRKAVIKMKQGHIYSNLWLFCLGTSSISRKSTALKRAKEFANSFNSARCMPGDFSQESMIEILSNESKQWFFKDEAGGFLTNIQKTYMQGTRDVLCSMYDNEDYHRKLRTTKNGENTFDVINPYLTIIFATTFDTFKRSTSFIDMTSGFLYRFLYFIPRHNNRTYMPLMPEDDSDIVDLSDLKDKLRKLYMLFLSGKEPIEFKLSDFGLKYYQEWQRERETQCNSRNYIEQSMFGRLIPMALKLAIIFKVGENGFIKSFAQWQYQIPTGYSKYIEINDEYIVEACRQIDTYFFQAAVIMAADVEKDESTNPMLKIEAELERAGGTLSRTNLMQKTHIKKREMDEYLESLLTARIITVKSEKSSSGRRTTYISLISSNDESDVDLLDISTLYLSNNNSMPNSYKPTERLEFANANPKQQKPKKNISLNFDDSDDISKFDDEDIIVDPKEFV